MTVTAWIFLSFFSFLALVSGLFDGGDFVSHSEKQKEISRDYRDSPGLGVCPSLTFDSVLNDAFFCSSDLSQNLLIGNRNVLNQNYQDVKPETIINVDDPPSVTSKEDSDSSKVIPVIIPPLVVKATPKEATSITPVPPAIEISEKQELHTTDTLTDDLAEGQTRDEAGAEFERKENAVDEDPVQPEQPDVIAPFSQWAEKKLEEAAIKDATKKDEPEVEMLSGAAVKTSVSNNNAKSTSGVFKNSKNFASPDCSAKIVGANSGSQGSGNVITSSRDEYFLNKCTDRAWFVVELCDSIKALKIQLANFELYSSSPNQFRVSLANIFPGRDKDWVEFGTFSYQDERITQTFVNEAGVVGKYVKVEVLSHHGAEHYCPVSLFKVFGIPEIDLISEDDNDEDGPEDSPDISSEDEPKNHPIVQTIKDAMHKVVNVFRPQNVSIVETLNTSSLQGASLRFKLRPETGDKYDRSVINRYHMIYFLLATQYTRVKEYSRIIGLHRALPQVCTQFGIEIQTDHIPMDVASYPWQFLKFVRLYHGEDFLVAMCNLESMELGQSRLVRPVSGSSSIPTSNNMTNSRTVSRSSADNKTHATIESTESVKRPEPEVQRDIISDNKTVGLSEEKTGTVQVQEVVTEAEVGVPGVGQEQVSKPVTSPSSPAGQTTWQKISNRYGGVLMSGSSHFIFRLKALERNVTLSTGFLEELSLKYIQQIEELNTAVKAANEAVQGIHRREELSRERNDKLEAQVESLTESVTSLEERLVELQDELLARHGLLILGEILVIGLVLMLCRPDQAKRKPSVNLGQEASQETRRRSLDTMRDNRQKVTGRLEARRRSFEVGCLGNGQLGSIVQQADSGLNKKQKKRKRRKDSKNLTSGLRHLTEEMESDNSNAQEVGPAAELDTRDFLSRHSDVISMQSTPRKVVASVPVPEVEEVNGWRSKEVKTVRFPPGKKLSSCQSRYGVSGVPPTQVSNIFTMLDNR